MSATRSMSANCLVCQSISRTSLNLRKCNLLFIYLFMAFHELLVSPSAVLIKINLYLQSSILNIKLTLLIPSCHTCSQLHHPWLALWYGMVSHWLSGHFQEYSPRNSFSNLKQHYSAA